MTIAAALQLALALLPMVETGVTEFVAYISALRTAAQQAGEWTPEQEAAYRAALFAKTADPAYQPDKP
jgi:hypothetical protein